MAHTVDHTPPVEMPSSGIGRINIRHHQLLTWSAYPMVAMFGLGAVLAHFVLPTAPSKSAAAITALYTHDHARIITGLILVMMAGCLYLPLFASISFQMARIEGPRPILAVTQMALGLVVAVMLIVSLMPFAVAALRTSRDPSQIRLMNDLGWITLYWPFAPALFQDLVIAVCVLSDTRPEPLLPRWVGYFNLFVAASFITGAPIPYFLHGPLAWNGLLAYYLESVTFFAWIFVMAVMVGKAVKRSDYEPARTADVRPA